MELSCVTRVFQDEMGSDNLTPNYPAGESQEKGCQRFSVSDNVNGLQHSSTRSDSFLVDTESFSHLLKEEMNSNSRITRDLTRKGSARGSEQKIHPSALETSTTATLHSTPEKPQVVAIPQVHHQITIKNGGVRSTTTKTKPSCKIISFGHSPPTLLSIDPRRIFLFFATLSSMGTILVIYFTLSMGRLNRDGSDQN